MRKPPEVLAMAVGAKFGAYYTLRLGESLAAVKARDPQTMPQASSDIPPPPAKWAELERSPGEREIEELENAVEAWSCRRASQRTRDVAAREKVGAETADRLTGWRASWRHVRDDYHRVHGCFPRLLAPERFSEKMQWRKLFDLDARFSVLCDKLRVRDYVAARVNSDLLVPLLWSGLADALPLERLEPPYVIKSSHASGHVLIIRGARDLNFPTDIRRTVAAWLKHNHGYTMIEPGYVNVRPHLLVERLIADQAGRAPIERRIFVFDGKAKIINTVFTENGVIRNGAFHTLDWVRLPWHFSRFVEGPFPRPGRLPEMIEIAEKLAAGYDHMRVDLYDCGDEIRVGEMSPYSWSGLARFRPDDADTALGRYWRLRSPKRRGLVTVSRCAPPCWRHAERPL